MPFSKLTKTALFSLAVAIVSAGLAFSLNFVLAQWAGPKCSSEEQCPPGGNIELREPIDTSPTAQTKAGALTVSGNSTDAKGLMVGGAEVDVNDNENLIYGNTGSASTGNLLLLQKNNGNDAFFKVTSAGDVNSSGCFGATFDDLSSNYYNGSLIEYDSNYQPTGVDKGEGYLDANAICGAGRHICTVSEMLTSIQCGNNQILSQGTNETSWILMGPPGFTKPADCRGWTRDGMTIFGQIWVFDSTNGTGGRGALTTCNVPNRFACCK